MSTFTYNPDTGEIFRNGKRFDSNAGRLRTVKFNGKTMQAHRVAWFLHYGEWPLQIVDHKDRNAHNNRKDNLRLASVSQNGMNRLDSKNTSGEKGVGIVKCAHAWYVKVKAGSFLIHSRASHSISAIVAARLIRRTLHGEFATV